MNMLAGIAWSILLMLLITPIDLMTYSGVMSHVLLGALVGWSMKTYKIKD